MAKNSDVAYVAVILPSHRQVLVQRTVEALEAEIRRALRDGERAEVEEMRPSGFRRLSVFTNLGGTISEEDVEWTNTPERGVAVASTPAATLFDLLK